MSVRMILFGILIVALVWISILIFYDSLIGRRGERFENKKEFTVLGWGINEDRKKIEQGAKYFMETCNLKKIPFEFIGIGWPFPAVDEKMLNSRDRFWVLDEALENRDDNEIVLVSDTFDVLFFKGPEYILSKFKSSGAEILFSGEKDYSWQWQEYKNSFEDNPGKTGPYIFLAAGTYIGYVKSIRKAVKEWINLVEDEDSSLKDGAEMGIMGAWLSKKLSKKFQIDTNAEIFWVTSQENEAFRRFSKTSSPPFINYDTNTEPACCHIILKDQIKDMAERILE